MRRYGPRTFIGEILMIALAALFASPLLILVSVAFRDPNSPGSVTDLPEQWTWDNLAVAVSSGRLIPALLNSVVVTVVATVVCIVLSSLAGYALARAFGKLPKALFIFFFAGLLLPVQLSILSVYTLMRDLGLLGSLVGLIIYYAGTTMPFSVFLYTMFARSLDVEYEEAARIDGCGPIRTFVYIAFPLLRPITGTVAILNAISIYNDFFAPLLFLSGSGQRTAPVAIQAFIGEFNTQWPVVFAGLLLTLLPILLVYFVLQRHIIQGFAGGLKG